ncbi:hypothetical protein ACH5RR_003078 [Cinchona calisaya]|uniref:Uncharacterized protein n=1 Tax=Cinchona calisaya TaxID=153742 RepID=A0ABD3ATT1_9GENT
MPFPYDRETSSIAPYVLPAMKNIYDSISANEQNGALLLVSLYKYQNVFNANLASLYWALEKVDASDLEIGRLDGHQKVVNEERCLSMLRCSTQIWLSMSESEPRRDPGNPLKLTYIACLMRTK